MTTRPPLNHNLPQEQKSMAFRKKPLQWCSGAVAQWYSADANNFLFLAFSDHRPVWGMWETTLKPGRDLIPMSGGLFNREIYLEGLKRRSEALKPITGGRLSVNNMCSIQ